MNKYAHFWHMASFFDVQNEATTQRDSFECALKSREIMIIFLGL
jgi:hypothetical protein